MRRKSALQRGLVWLFSVWAIIVSLAFTITWPGQAFTAAHLKTNLRQTSGAVSLAQRIERIENGLLPPSVLKGEMPVRMRLADRMQHYKTPGVSIAVINDGRIE